ncbi:MAG: VWA domain-containing protein [Acidobacteria bacterium]|nr:VWA domain-containing protein [Acidobacteriota bacterium]
MTARVKAVASGAAFVFVFAVPTLVSQGPTQQEPVFRTETALIEIEVRATARRGATVVDLTKENFTVFESGEKQKIATFDFVPLPSSISRGDPKVAETPSPKSTTPTSTADTPREETLIYIASRVGERQRKETHAAIKKFIETNIRSGVRVSLEGLPFTSDKQALLAMLDKMLQQGGKDGIPSLVNIATASMDEQIANLTAYTGITTPTYLSTTPSIAHMQRTHFERAIVEGYTSLINQLGVYPGKKILVLFSRGLRFDAENAMYWRQLAAAAMRARVIMHAIDVRGLLAMPVGGDASHSSLAVEAESVPTGLPPFEKPELADKPFSQDDLRFGQQGLMSLVEGTGGKAVVNNNDLAAIFDNVNEELGGYYLLGYYPRDAARQGRFRKIKIEVDRPGVKLSFRDGYFEDKQFSELSNSEKRRTLERVLYSNQMPSEIPLRVGYEFFRGDDGRPVAAYCVGIEARSIPVARSKKGVEVNLVMLSRAESLDAGRVPFGDEQSLQLVFKPEEFRRMQADSTAMLQFPSALKLPAGAYRWKVVVRDEGSGQTGVYQSTVQVPVFEGESSPSSLLLTGRMLAAEGAVDSDKKSDKKGNKADEESEAPRGVHIEGLRFYPQPENVFRHGGSIHMVYGLYNVSSGLLEAPPAPRVFLVLGEQALDRAPFKNYEAFPSPDRKEVHYVATLDTAALKPGAYKLIVSLPNGTDAIFREFTLVP